MNIVCWLSRFPTGEDGLGLGDYRNRITASAMFSIAVGAFPFLASIVVRQLGWQRHVIRRLGGAGSFDRAKGLGYQDKDETLGRVADPLDERLLDAVLQCSEVPLSLQRVDVHCVNLLLASLASGGVINKGAGTG